MFREFTFLSITFAREIHFPCPKTYEKTGQPKTFRRKPSWAEQAPSPSEELTLTNVLPNINPIITLGQSVLAHDYDIVLVFVVDFFLLDAGLVVAALDAAALWTVDGGGWSELGSCLLVVGVLDWSFGALLGWLAGSRLLDSSSCLDFFELGLAGVALAGGLGAAASFAELGEAVDDGLRSTVCRLLA